MGVSSRREFLLNAAAVGSGFSAAGFFPRRIIAEESSGFRRRVYRDLGSTGFRVTEIGFGAMNTRDPELIKALFP